jgi:iron(III) transport system substrate-binding protein
MERLHGIPVSRLGALGGAAFSLLLLVACTSDDRTSLRVRTSLPDALLEQVERSFEAQHPQVDVRFVRGDDAQAAAELEAQDEGVPFDVWWGPSGILLERAALRGLLRPASPSAVWRPLLVTPFVIAFNRAELTLASAPSDWIDVFHFRWRDELVMVDPARMDVGAWFVGAVVARAVRADQDMSVGMDWLRRLDEQVARYVPDQRAALRELSVGDAQLTVISKAAADAELAAGAAWLGYRLPQSGTPLLVRGIGVVEGTRQAHAAALFIDWVSSPEEVTVAEITTGWEAADGLSVSEDGTVLIGLEGWRGWPLGLDVVVGGMDGWLAEWRENVRGRGK